MYVIMKCYKLDDKTLNNWRTPPPLKSDSISKLMYFKIFKFYKIPQEILSNPEAFFNSKQIIEP